MKGVFCASSSLAIVAAFVAGPAVGQGASLAATPDEAASAPAPDRTQEAEAPPEPEKGPATADGSTDDIVVTGFRRSLQRAADIKRESAAIVDALVAEDIGKFPDNNAAEALSRVTGVQVERFRDEANGVAIRGLPNVQTTLQGRDIFTASGRAVSFQDFPAQSLSKLEVYKTTTADNIEGGIAGLINIGLRRPFDFKGFQVAGGLRATYNDQSHNYDPNGSFLVTNRWTTGLGEIGALVNVSYTRANYLNSVRYQGFQDYPRAAQVVLPASVGRNFIYPQDIGLFFPGGYRERPSVNGSLQWKPVDNFELYVDGLWQAFRGQSGDDFFGIAVQANNPTLENVVLTPDGRTPESLSVTVGRVNGPSKRVTQSTTDTYQGALGFKWDTGIAQIDSDLAYTTSKIATQYNIFETILSRPLRLDIRYNVAGGVDFTPSGVDFSDPSSYNFRALYDQRVRSKGDQIQWQGNVKLDTGLDLLPRFDVGLRYTNRNAAAQSGDRYGSFPQLNIALATVPGADDAGIVQTGLRDRDVQQFRTLYQLTTRSIVDNLGALRKFVQNGLVTANASSTLQAAWAPPVPNFNPVNSFTAREKTYAAYAQVHVVADLVVPIKGTIGARIIITDNALKGTTSQTTSTNGQLSTVLIPVDTQQSYVDVLPTINLEASLTNEIKLRLSRTESLTRPGFNQINPALVIVQGSIGGITSYTGSGGNPDLQPVRSENYDASLEYYFNRAGYVSVAGFYRKIHGFIDTFGTPEVDANVGPILVYRPRNAGSGQIKGVEVAVSTFLDFLPGWMSGFGVQANGTYIDGKETLPSVPGLSVNAGEIPGVSRWSYNLIGLYEKGPVSFRLAYNKRTRFISSYTAPGVYATVYNRSISRLDALASYDLTSNVTLTADATNLLGKPWRSYVGDPAFPRDVRYEARVYALGVRFRF